jgi:MFS family permease
MDRRKSMISVMAVFFLIIGNSTVTAALQSIIEAFPDASLSSVYLILTLPTVCSIPAALLSGMLTAKKVKYKTIALIGMLIFTIAGVLPYFMSTIGSILVTRAIFGLGIGLLNPIGNTLSILYFGPQEGSKVIGYGNSSMNLGGVALQMLGGILCGINWRYTFLAYLLGIIPIVLTLTFMREPEKVEMPQGESKRMPGIVYLLGLMLMLGQLFIYPLYLNLSTIVITSIPGGNTTIAATLLSVVTISGMVIGVVFGRLFKVLGHFTLDVAFAIGCAGLMLVYSANSIALICIACIFCGINATMVMCSIIAEVGLNVSPDMVSKASGSVMSIYCLAPIIATAYASLVAMIPNIDPMRYIFFVGAIAEVIMLLVWVLTHLRKKKN